MELADILQVDSAEVIPKAEYDGQPLQERVPLLPDALSIEEFESDPATFLTASEGLALCQDYFVSGNLADSARRLRVRYVVALRASKEPWFGEELFSLEQQLKIGQKARLDKLLGKAIDQLEERLEHGDEVSTKDGIVTIAVKARDLAAIAAILTERRDKLDDATKPAVGAPKGRMESLADDLRAKARGATNATVVPLKQVSDGS